MEKKRKKKVKDTTRNNNFVEAFIYLKRKKRKELGTNILLAGKMGIDPDSISNVIHCHTAVTDNFIASFQEATDGIFNVHFLRGESDVMLAKDLATQKAVSPTLSALEPTVAAIIAEKNARLADKDETIASLKRELEGKDAHIADLLQQVADLRQQIASKKGLTEIGRSLSEHAEQGSVSPHVGK